MAKLIISRGAARVVIGRSVLESRREWAELGQISQKIEAGTVTAGELAAARRTAQRRLCELDRRLGR